MNLRFISRLLTVLFLLPVLTASATTYTVTNILATGAGSLEAAITAANGNAGMDTIVFNILTAPYSIDFNGATMLPIFDDVFIDGTSQPGYSSRPVIELTKSGGPGIIISNSNPSYSGSHIKGLCINSSAAMGINIASGKNIIEGCFIGTDTTGTIAKPNGNGIFIQTGVGSNIIGGVGNFKNLISGNIGFGIYMPGTSSNNKIFGNYIGVDVTGNSALANSVHGISLNNSSDHNQIGGLSKDSMNVISSNGNIGIDIENNSKSNIILNNIIGLGADGITALGNSVHGIYVSNGSDSTIIGSYMGRNIISSNGSIGINIELTKRTIIQNNFIGTTEDGSVARGNAAHGIQNRGSRETIIGGDHTKDGNIISASGSGNHGINLDYNIDQTTHDTTLSNSCIIKGNYIGTDITGMQDFGNGGIGIVLKADSCIVGSLLNNEGNIISASKGYDVTHNVYYGCGLLLANANHNSVTGNLIGTTADTTALGNNDDGINISIEDPGYKASYNTINYNVIAYNQGNGISVGLPLPNPPNPPNPLRIYQPENFNNARFNSIYCNVKKGIFLDLNEPNNCGNLCHVAPVINTLQSSASKIVGVANGLVKTDSIDIYLMTECINCTTNPQGKIYVATISPDASGNWSYTSGTPLPGTMVATVTDAQGNTSEFSLCYTPCGAKAVATASDSLLDLNHVPDKTVTFTSTSQGDPLSPLPLSTWWILNSKDTASAFSSNSTASLVFSQHASASAIGPSIDTVYLVVKQGACSDTLSFPVTSFFIPNLVTPNGDQKNDKWFVSQRSDLFEAKIFNRWGDLVFSKDGYTDDWDVSSVNDGVYYYYLKDKTGKGKSYKGWVQIVR